RTPEEKTETQTEETGQAASRLPALQPPQRALGQEDSRGAPLLRIVARRSAWRGRARKVRRAEGRTPFRPDASSQSGRLDGPRAGESIPHAQETFAGNRRARPPDLSRLPHHVRTGYPCLHP